MTEIEITASNPLRFIEHADGDAVAYRVTEREPGRRLVVKIDDPTLPWGGTWEHVLEPRGEGTHLRTTERGHIDGVFVRGIARLLMDPRASLLGYQADLADYPGCKDFTPPP